MQLNTQQIYKSIQNKLAEAEAIRVKNRIPALLTLSGLLLVAIATIAHQIYYSINDPSWLIPTGWVIVILVICFFGFFGAGWFFFRKIEKLFKHEIVPGIVKHLGEGFTYDVDKEIDEALIRQSRLFRKYWTYGGDHLVTGPFEGRTLEFSNISMRTRGKSSESSSSGGSQKTLFKGILIHIQLKHVLPDPFWIIPKKGVFAWRFPYLKKVADGQFVKIHDLNEKYEVWTPNPDLTQKLLSPAFVRIINGIHTDFLTKNVTKRPLLFAFFENHICLAFSKRTSVFSMPIFPVFTPINTVEFVERQLLVVNAALRLEEVL